MAAFINAQLGRIFLGLALVWTLYCLATAGAATSANTGAIQDRPVYVELNTADLSKAKEENFFPKNTAAQYAGGERCLFVPEKKIKEYEAVELDIPPAPVMRSPQLLPEPGPSLEGAQKLPRFGDEFKNVEVKDTKTAIKTVEKVP